MSAKVGPHKVLTVVDMARIWKCHRATAYRRMLALEEQFGVKVIGRRGKRGDLYTTAEAAMKVCPELQPADDDSVDGRIENLENRVQILERRASTR